MSFLSRSKLNLSENNSTLLSRLEDSKSKQYSPSPITSDLMGSLDGFRQGLRRQLTEKLNKTPSSATNNSKFLEVPSPKNTKKFDIGFSLKQRNSPIRVETSYGRSTPSASGKSSQKHFDLMKDLNRKIEERSPPRKNASRDKDLTLLASFDKKFTGGSSQNTFISPNYRSSLTKSTKSPLRDYFSTLESKTPEYRRSQIFEKTSNRTPKDIKHSLIKILDNTPKRTAMTESASKLDSDRPHSALSQAFNQLRSSRIQLGGGSTFSPERKEGTESLKSLSHFVSESFKNREKEREVTKKSGLFNGHTTEIRLDDETSNANSVVSRGAGGISDKFTVSKIYELQDMFQGAGEKEFNTLSSDYIEELIKLSSIIMQRVKTSSYYNRE